MDTPRERALARKEELEREIAYHQRNVEAHQREVEVRQSEMREVETFIAQYPRFSGENEQRDDAHAKTSKDDTRDSRPPNAANGPISQEQFEADARRLLIENGRPMQRGQLVKKFRSSGLRVGGTDEIKEMRNFGVKIWKAKDRFINILGEGYWPRDIACAVVNYHPSDS